MTKVASNPKVASRLTTYTLPWDCARCAPELPGKQCEQCLRWFSMPGQTFGPRTATSIGVEGPGMTGCNYVPVIIETNKGK